MTIIAKGSFINIYEDIPRILQWIDKGYGTSCWVTDEERKKLCSYDLVIQEQQELLENILNRTQNDVS